MQRHLTTAESFRALAFWSLDRLQGGPIAFHLKEVAAFYEDPASIAALRPEQLKQFLTHACATTAYYRQFADATELRDFPVLQKRTIRERTQDFLSSRYASGELVPAETSGSYGTPFTFHITREKRARQRAEVILAARLVGYDVGLRNAHITTTDEKKNLLRCWMRNQVLLDPTHLTPEWLEQQRRLLRGGRIRFLSGYPSTLIALASYCSAAGDGPSDFTLRGILSASESLPEGARDKIQTIFGCPVLSRYSTEELGLIGMECLAARQHHLNQATLVIEVLDLKEDKPVAPGEPGRVVVTDLWSQAMPLIRYDVGDIGVLAEHCACGWPGPVFVRLEGRAIETIYDSQGQRISGCAFDEAMIGLDTIIQFQFVQQAPARYTIRLCVLPSYSEEQIIRERLLGILGSDALVHFEYVEEIPALKSGKRPYIVNEMPRDGRQPATELSAR